ncbi:MAG: hypothetical protein QOD65_4012, partial [Gaiellales bacterium]|nr:hypothetical protein [Gaiellales bacterium]
MLLACLAAPAPAGAFSAEEGRAAADRAAAAWARDHQQRDGAFVDYVSRRPTYGYAGVLLGYGLLRAGERSGDRELIRRGFRAIDAVLSSDHPQRGVFDSLANSTAYAFAARSLADDPSFRALRPRWETYLRGITQPYIKSTNLKACTADPVCFHNHEVVGAFGDLQLLATGLRSTVPGAKLSDPLALRESAMRVLEEEIPLATGRAASYSFGDSDADGLGLLSDTLTWPLAYHAFSTAMVAGAAADLGSDLPAPTRAALRGTVGALAGFMAPDGDVAYLGRRQQQAWALASAIYAASVAARTPGFDAREMKAVADRAFARLVSVNTRGPGGLGAVPRALSPSTGYHGVDANEVVPAALTIFMLNLASDEAAESGSVEAGALPADADGAFLEPEKTGLAAVRHGELWYAVHRRIITYDRRYDFGLVALKQRIPDGSWRDVLRPRPNTRGPSEDSAGPVIEKDGVRYMAYGDTNEARPGGVVIVRGGYRSEEGVWLRQGVTFRFAPVRDGVAMSFPLRAGDVARMTTYVRAGEGRVRGRSVVDPQLRATLSMRPDSAHVVDRGYASCCDEHLVAGTAFLRPATDRSVTYTVRARPVRDAGGRPGTAP